MIKKWLAGQLCAMEIKTFLEFRSLPNEIKMCRFRASSESCGNGEMVNGATSEEFALTDVALLMRTKDRNHASNAKIYFRNKY